MAELMRPSSHEETIAALDAAAKTREGGDAFRLRIQRRRVPQEPPQIYALFEDARVEHFAMPETWLPRLVGPGAGGIFELTGYHISNAIMSIGPPLRIPIEGELRPPNIEVVREAGWLGPRSLAYPRPNDTQQPVAFSVGGAGDPSGTRRDSAPTGPAPSVPSVLASTIREADPSRLLAAEEALRAQQRAVEQEQARWREERLRSEILAATKTQTDAVMDALRRSQEQMSATLQQLASAPKAPALDVGALMQSVTPLVLGFLQASSAAREEATKRQDAILTALLAKPPQDQGVLDRMVRMTEAMVEAQRNKPDPSAAMVTHMSEAMAGMANVTMQLVHTAAEMSSGGPPAEPGWVKAVREGAKLITAMMQTQAQIATESARRGGPPPMQPPAIAGNGPTPTVQAPAIDQIADAIRKKVNVQRVTLAILNNLRDPSIVTAFAEAGGDPEVLLRNRLGGWLEDPTNAQYIQSLLAEIGRVGKERGLTAADVASHGGVAGAPSAPESDEGDEDADEDEDDDEGDEGEEDEPASASATARA